MGMLGPLLGIVFLATSLAALQAVPYPEKFSFGQFEKELAQAKEMSESCQKEGQIQCPTPNFQVDDAWPCVGFEQMCDGKDDCPQGEDEHPSMCMYHHMVEGEINRLKKSIENGKRGHK